MADGTVIERALDATCGNPLVEERAVTEENRAALRRIASDSTTEPTRRARAVYLLGLWADDETTRTLQSILRDLDEQGRIAAASILGRIDTEAAFELLRELSEDASSEVRRIAINGIGTSHMPAATEVLRRLAHEDASELNRRRAAELLNA